MVEINLIWVTIGLYLIAGAIITGISWSKAAEWPFPPKNPLLIMIFITEAALWSVVLIAAKIARDRKK